MRVGVGDAAEDRAAAFVEQLRRTGRDTRARASSSRTTAKPTERPRQAPAPSPAAPRLQEARAARDHDEEAGDGAHEHRDRQQPAGDQLPGRQREEIEGERPAEDRIDDGDAPTAVPPYQYNASVVQSAIMLAPVMTAITSGARRARSAEDRFDRQLDRLAVDQDRDAGQLAEPRRLEDDEGTVEDEECDGGEAREDRRLDIDVFQNTSAYPSELEPEGVDVVGEGGPAAEQDRRGRGDENPAGRSAGAGDAAEASRRQRGGGQS